MAFTLEANINVLWQNLIALNASLLRENEENRAELMQTKELLQKEMENSRMLQENNEIQQQKIAKLCSKMVAVRQIVLHEPDDDPTMTVTTTNFPVIVKVESVEMDPIATEHDNTGTAVLPVNVCIECDKKFCSSSSLKRHKMAIHLTPKYRCPKCTLRFPRRDYVKKHIQQAHRDEECSSMKPSISTKSAKSARTTRSTTNL